MSFIFKYTLSSLQGHICLLQEHKVCTRTRYFNACSREAEDNDHQDLCSGEAPEFPYSTGMSDILFCRTGIS